MMRRSLECLNWPRHGAASHRDRSNVYCGIGLSQLAASRRGLTHGSFGTPELVAPSQLAASRRGLTPTFVRWKFSSKTSQLAASRRGLTRLPSWSRSVRCDSSQLAASRRGLTRRDARIHDADYRLNWPRHGAASHCRQRHRSMKSCLNWPRHGAASHQLLREVGVGGP